MSNGTALPFVSRMDVEEEKRTSGAPLISIHGCPVDGDDDSSESGGSALVV